MVKLNKAALMALDPGAESDLGAPNVSGVPSIPTVAPKPEPAAPKAEPESASPPTEPGPSPDPPSSGGAEPDTPPEKEHAAAAAPPPAAGTSAAPPLDPYRAGPSSSPEVVDREADAARDGGDDATEGRGRRAKRPRLAPDGEILGGGGGASSHSRNPAAALDALNPHPTAPRPAWEPKSLLLARPERRGTPTVRPAVGASRAIEDVPAKAAFDEALGAFHRAKTGKFKPPKFNHEPLDLHRVFTAVQSLGGYDAVTREKRWKRACEALGQDLSKATSAGHTMRRNYERFLLDFEVHLAGETGAPGKGASALEAAGSREPKAGAVETKGDGGTEDVQGLGWDSDTDSDFEEVERLRLDLRRKKAELEEQLRRAPPAAAPPARRGGRFEGAWLAYGDVSPLENAAAACFARELPDLDEARPRWAQCQLCLGWRDLGRAPGKPRKQNAPTREVASERVRARLALAEAGGWRPGERLGFGPAPDPERKVTAADLREAAKAAAAATPEPVRGAPSAVDALAAAAAAIVADKPPEEASIPAAAPAANGTLEAMAEAAMTGVAEEDRDMFATDEAKEGMRGAMREVVEAVVSAFAANREPVEPASSDASLRPKKLKFVIKKPLVALHNSESRDEPAERKEKATERDVTGVSASDAARAILQDGSLSAAPTFACECVPPVPEGWSRWEALRKRPAANGSWAADCYYRTPAGPDGRWKVFVLRSEEEIAQFLRADAARDDSVFAGLTLDWFLCKPFTRRHTQKSGVGRVGEAPRLTHKWRAELGDPDPDPAGERRRRITPDGEDAPENEESGDEGDAVGDAEGDASARGPGGDRPHGEENVDAAPPRNEESDDEEAAAIARVVEGPLWY